MANEGTLELGLIDVRGRTARDPNVEVFVFGGSSPRRPLKRLRRLTYPPRPHSIQVPAFPSERVLSCDIVPSRFRPRSSGFFSITDGETVRRDLTVFRLPERFRARFKSFRSLPPAFDPLKRVLNGSRDICLRSGEPVGAFIEGFYDQASGEALRTAKAALLNLFAKLERSPVPRARRSWFSFVERVLVVDRERFIAIADAEMARVVRSIKDDIASFEGFRHSAAENHHENLPARYRVAKTKMLSIKTRETDGNLQLTLGPGTDPESGAEVFLLDADIDESGDLLGHLADIFKHKFTGGTHPFDIHEYLQLAFPGVDLGYELY